MSRWIRFCSCSSLAITARSSLAVGIIDLVVGAMNGDHLAADEEGVGVGEQLVGVVETGPPGSRSS